YTPSGLDAERCRTGGQYGSRRELRRLPCRRGQMPPLSSPGCGCGSGTTSSAPCLAGAAAPANGAGALSDGAGAEPKARVNAPSSAAAMILDMSAFLLVLVDEELPIIASSATVPGQEQRPCQARVFLAQTRKIKENRALSLFLPSETVWGKSP